MSANSLLAELKAADLTVVEESGWKNRGNNWAVDNKPEGVMQHHTAPPNPYPIKKLYGPPFYRIKCNMATHEDGTLFLVAYKACNYSSGRGMLSVLTQNVRKSIAPTHNATQSGSKSGNRSFWNYENSHPGDGSDIPSVQLDTIIISNRVVNAHFELNPEQVISHAEWTSRKPDPNWNGSNRVAIEQIRVGVAGSPPSSDEGTVLLPMELETWVTNLSDDNIRDMRKAGLYQGDPQHWINLRDSNPTHSSWERFYTDVDVNAKIGAAT